MAALDIHGLRKAFGGNVIIPDVTLALEPGLITSLVATVWIQRRLRQLEEALTTE